MEPSTDTKESVAAVGGQEGSAAGRVRRSVGFSSYRESSILLKMEWSNVGGFPPDVEYGLTYAKATFSESCQTWWLKAAEMYFSPSTGVPKSKTKACICRASRPPVALGRIFLASQPPGAPDVPWFVALAFSSLPLPLLSPLSLCVCVFNSCLL